MLSLVCSQVFIVYPRRSFNTFLSILLLLFSGDPVLHSSLALEELGGWQNCRLENGPWPRNHNVSLVPQLRGSKVLHKWVIWAIKTSQMDLLFFNWDCLFTILQSLNDILNLQSRSEAEKRQKKKLLLDYLYANLKNHNFWAYRYFFCEFLGILNIVGECWTNYFLTFYSSLSLKGQMFLMDRFFDGTFLTFGIEVISFAERDQEDRIDPMVRRRDPTDFLAFQHFQVYIFPRMTKCTFHKFGTSGEIEKHDAMCILPLNIGNFR